MVNVEADSLAGRWVELKVYYLDISWDYSMGGNLVVMLAVWWESKRVGRWAFAKVVLKVV